jgi:hypothetical protein
MLMVRSLLLLLVLDAVVIDVGRSQESVPFDLQDNLVKVRVHLDGQPVDAVLDS